MFFLRMTTTSGLRWTCGPWGSFCTSSSLATCPSRPPRSQVQVDQLNMAAFLWYLEKREKGICPVNTFYKLPETYGNVYLLTMYKKDIKLPCHFHFHFYRSLSDLSTMNYVYCLLNQLCS